MGITPPPVINYKGVAEGAGRGKGFKKKFFIPLNIVQKNQKPVLKIRESLPSLFINLNSMGELSLNVVQNFKFPGF